MNRGGQYQTERQRAGTGTEQKTERQKQSDKGMRRIHAAKADHQQYRAEDQYETVGFSSRQHTEKRLRDAEHQFHRGNAETRVLIGYAAVIRQRIQQNADIRPDTASQTVKQARDQAENDHRRNTVTGIIFLIMHNNLSCIFRSENVYLKHFRTKYSKMQRKAGVFSLKIEHHLP